MQTAVCVESVTVSTRQNLDRINRDLSATVARLAAGARDADQLDLVIRQCIDDAEGPLMDTCPLTATEPERLMWTLARRLVDLRNLAHSAYPDAVEALLEAGPEVWYGVHNPAEVDPDGPIGAEA